VPASPVSQTVPRLRAAAVWAVLLSPQPLQTLAAQQLSLILCYFFPPDCETPPLTARPSPPTFSCEQAHRRFSSRRRADADPFLLGSSSSPSLRAFRLRLQPATSPSVKASKASVPIWRAVLRPCLQAPVGQSAVGRRRVQDEVAALGADKPESHTEVWCVAGRASVLLVKALLRVLAQMATSSSRKCHVSK